MSQQHTTSFTNSTPKNRAGILVFDAKKRLLVIHRVKDNRVPQEFYAIPGGTIEEHETTEQAALRELKEETGLTIHLGPLFLELTNQNRQEYYFLAQSWTGTPMLGGQEALDHNSSNQFNLVWLTREQLMHENLYPEPLKTALLAYYTHIYKSNP